LQAAPHHEDVAWVSRLAAAIRHRHRTAQVMDLQRYISLSAELSMAIPEE